MVLYTSSLGFRVYGHGMRVLIWLYALWFKLQTSVSGFVKADLGCRV